MKLLAVSAVLFAMMALTTADDQPDVEKRSEADGLIPPGEQDVFKRSIHYSRRWIRYGRRYYRYVARALTWAHAQLVCQSMRANLASVHSWSEYRRIQWITRRYTHGYPRTWLGGSDAQQERIWLWIDGTRFTYSYWCHGQPNNYRGKQHCLQMNYSGGKCWNDTACYARLPFVCVRRI